MKRISRRFCISQSSAT